VPRIRVVTDSTCDIPDSLLRQLDITVVPLSIAWDAESYLDKPGVANPQLLKRVVDPGGPRPMVLAPDVEDLSRVYRSMRDTCDGVISIHVSSRLSETYANAAIAREGFGPVGHGGPFPVAVVDSMSLTMGLGWLVLAVAQAAKAGLDLSRLATMASRLRGQTHVAFITEQLDGLIKSGGAANLASQWSSLASMRPLFNLEEGQVVVYERTRTRPKARDALYNFVEDFPRIADMAAIYTGPQNDLEHLLTRVGAIYPRDRILIVQPGLATSAWLGPDALGVAVYEGEET
jgi:DegV family protein with EDD domain